MFFQCLDYSGSNKVGSLITKDVGHVSLPTLVGDRLLLSLVKSDHTLYEQDMLQCFQFYPPSYVAEESMCCCLDHKLQYYPHSVLQ